MCSRFLGFSLGLLKNVLVFLVFRLIKVCRMILVVVGDIVLRDFSFILFLLLVRWVMIVCRFFRFSSGSFCWLV